MGRTIRCDKCGNEIIVYKNPVPTVDALIVHPGKGVVLVERRFEPLGWALPGGFVEYDESVEDATVREAFEETGLRVKLDALLGVYSDPARDKRLHTISTVFIALTDNPEDLKGGDDAAQAVFFPLDRLPSNLAFDHGRMLDDFRRLYAGKYGVL